jgi:hypothetical protein
MLNDPTIAVLDRLSRGGWNSLEAAQGEFDAEAKRIGNEAKIEHDRQAAIVVAALGTPEGKALLDLLILKSLLLPLSDFERGAQTAEAYALAKAKREGRESIVLMLIGMLQYAAGQRLTPGGDL